MEALVLAGGMGTRLQGVVNDRPKPMAEVAGKPFLHYLLARLSHQGISRVVLSVGYMWETIREYFGDFFNEMELVYAVEETPLGTGGGIKLAMAQTGSKNVIILNGDTFIDVNITSMEEFHKAKNSDISLSLKYIEDASRYGTVTVDDDGKVTGFLEKEVGSNGTINTGLYMVNRRWYMEKAGALPEKHSFEKEILEASVGSDTFFAFETDGYFIDIGIPEDYHRAGKELPQLLSL